MHEQNNTLITGDGTDLASNEKKIIEKAVELSEHPLSLNIIYIGITN